MKKSILSFLKDSPGYVSGEEISRSLDISRAAVWKSMEQLRALGYEVEAVPHRGYCLVSSPDKLLADEIQHGLKTRAFGREIVTFQTIPSTMDEAFRRGMEGAKEGAVICAETQTQGRGRMGRTWVSTPARGIYCSIVLRPRLSPKDLGKITLLAAVALVEAVREVTGVKASIKWPNDLLVGGKKLAGILMESRAETDEIKFLVAGIGINVNTDVRDLIEGATSLKCETGKTVSRVALLQAILRRFEHWYLKAVSDGFDDVLEVWKTHTATLGRRVRWSEGTVKGEGVALDLAEDGGLLVRCANGTVVKRTAGDIVLQGDL